MKKVSKLLVLVTFLLGWALPSWAQAPSTEGQDFWVTFLRADADSPAELKLTISARDSCIVTIQQQGVDDIVLRVGKNSSTEIGSNTTTVKDINGIDRKLTQGKCYSSTNETAKYTALHVTATKDISLFAGNFRIKSFDATNVLPTTSLLDDYVIQTFPASDHSGDGSSQGSHFAIIAVEDGETVVDYTLPDGIQTAGGKTGTQTATLQKGQVWYVWTGKKAKDAADLSSTIVKARDNKKIAVFQGCPHTNIPYMVEDRDHIISQAMPTAYWGSEFGITASRRHRRDIVAIMALNDETKVYINDEKGNKQLVHTFDFNTDKKHYWTFEIGEEVAYFDSDKSNLYPKGSQLPAPLVIDSSCYLTTSCPVGVHLFMVSNRYDEETATHDKQCISDPAMLWISPIEQVIKEINFSTYHTEYIDDGRECGTKFHYMNIVTSKANVDSMKWNGSYIAKYFHPLRGNNDYSYARIEIPKGNHNLKGHLGFLAHVYGYGERESYAYSCGSSTVERSISFNDDPLLIDSISPRIFCINEDIKMKLNIGNNDYETVEWDFGDGVSEYSEKGENTIMHSYSNPGWYDLTVKAKYINPCTGKDHNDTLGVTFLVWRADTVFGGVEKPIVITLDEYKKAKPTQKDSLNNLVANGVNDSVQGPNCYDTLFVYYQPYCLETEEIKDTIFGQDSVVNNGKKYYVSTDVVDTSTNDNNCPHYVRYYVKVKTCLKMEIEKSSESCPENNIIVHYTKEKGEINDPVRFVVPGVMDTTFNISFINTDKPTPINLPTARIKKPGYYHSTLTITDANDCNPNPQVFPIDFTVNYPEDIFDFKFTNVLAVRKDAGYNFRNYQWYINGKPVGGDVSVLYLGEDVALREDKDTVYVVLTDYSGMVLKSCPQTIKYKDGQLKPNKAPARKVMQNQRIYILRDEQVYDIFGQKVK